MFIPTTSEPANPGPRVTATASMASSPAWACDNACSTTAKMLSTCMREATSGNTPPYWACWAACEATMLERMKRPFSTTEAAVSSQEVSMPRMRVSSLKLRSGSASRSRHLEHEIGGEGCQHFETAVRAGPDRVLHPGAQLALGIVQSRLEGEHHVRQQPILVDLQVGEVGGLVDLQPQPVAEAVDVAGLGLQVFHHGGMSARLEPFAGHDLIVAAGRVGLQLGEDGLVSFEHILVQRLQFLAGVAQRPRPGEVVEVAAAGLAGEQIKDDGLADRNRLVVLAGAVR